MLKGKKASHIHNIFLKSYGEENRDTISWCLLARVLVISKSLKCKTRYNTELHGGKNAGLAIGLGLFPLPGI